MTFLTGFSTRGPARPVRRRMRPAIDSSSLAAGVPALTVYEMPIAQNTIMIRPRMLPPTMSSIQYHSSPPESTKKKTSQRPRLLGYNPPLPEAVEVVLLVALDFAVVVCDCACPTSMSNTRIKLHLTTTDARMRVMPCTAARPALLYTKSCCEKQRVMP